MTDLDYPFTIRHLSEEEGGGYLIEFPDLPGCMSDGETIDETVENGKEAMLSWLDVAREAGRDIPDPNSLGRYSGQWRMRVPKSLHADLARQAKRDGVSLNALATSLLAKGLGGRQHS